MDDETAALAVAIGGRVRLERQSRRWTLDRLAEAAGVSRRMVVNVEQGAVNPSVGSLLRISDALGVGLPALVEPPEGSTVKVTRKGSGATLWSSGAGGRAVLLAGTDPPDVVELWDWTLAPGDHHASEPHKLGSEELQEIGIPPRRRRVGIGSRLDGTLGRGTACRASGVVVGTVVTRAGLPRMMPHVRPDLPAGTVTFLFTDIAGSTRLLHELGAEAYTDALAEHRRMQDRRLSVEYPAEDPDPLG